MTSQKKIANKTITCYKRCMIHVGIRLHKKNAQIAVADEYGKILMNRKGAGMLSDLDGIPVTLRLREGPIHLDYS